MRLKESLCFSLGLVWAKGFTQACVGVWDVLHVVEDGRSYVRTPSGPAVFGIVYIKCILLVLMVKYLFLVFM